MDITVPWGGSWVGYKGDSIPSSLLADSEDHATSHLILLPPRFPAIIHYIVDDLKEAFYPSIACQDLATAGKVTSTDVHGVRRCSHF